MIGEGGLHVVITASFLCGSGLLWIFIPLVLFMDIVLQALNMLIGKSSHAQDPEWVVALVDFRDSNVLHNFGRRHLHNIFNGVGHRRQHFWIDESPYNAEETIQPLYGLGKQVGSSLIDCQYYDSRNGHMKENPPSPHGAAHYSTPYLDHSG
jgi:hypothetical protein